jgi:hypothetical protein
LESTTYTRLAVGVLEELDEEGVLEEYFLAEVGIKY